MPRLEHAKMSMFPPGGVGGRGGVGNSSVLFDGGAPADPKTDSISDQHTCNLSISIFRRDLHNP